ncbi:DUF1800 domain-containing protein [Pseudorhodoplanes sp.]|uniref:DUF1800 domain-containing protein n=1 Tax=Pseudorhodoplanes sp. TaxID=1934341 RepID=UPI002D0A20F5|nr:DUF1800 family protein [Pseudorhodoplanes sp.]HWV40476.1 DUF1800 family protein [Pseudorhodoplanes sp.]
MRDPDLQTAILIHRFGFVPKPGGLTAAGRDARAALLAELDQPSAYLIASDDLLASGEAFRAAYGGRTSLRAERLKERHEANAKPQMQADGNATPKMQGDGEAMVSPAAPPKQVRMPSMPALIYRDEAKARFDAAFQAPIGFAERLVWFWSNHFCVSAGKGQVQAICGAFEREAIRPHITGKFLDMLLAVESHPAMLIYLDNASSIGPTSPAGKRGGKGLNENLAREILELHTVGVDAGYAQDDVTAFAKVLTGWTFARVKTDPETAGEFKFEARFHEPGPKRIMQRDFGKDGIAQGRAVLTMLARHPATATHIARKLVRHFISDDPSPALVERLAQRFRDTDGDLKEIAIALVTSPEAVSPLRSKLRSPAEWMSGIARATSPTSVDLNTMLQGHNLLGYPLWRPPAPKGFSDSSADWLAGIAQRLDIATHYARRNLPQGEIVSIAEEAFGPLLTKETRQTLERAESRQQALALLLMAPEFQRR